MTIAAILRCRVLLPLLHLFACVAIQLGLTANWWRIAIIDFPIGLVAIIIAGIGEEFLKFRGFWPLVSFVILGTPWWFFLGAKADAKLDEWRLSRKLISSKALLPYLLPSLHILICASSLVVGQEAISNVLFLVDFPISWLVFMLFAFTPSPFFALFVFGTLWWCLVNREIRGVYGMIQNLRNTRGESKSQL